MPNWCEQGKVTINHSGNRGSKYSSSTVALDEFQDKNMEVLTQTTVPGVSEKSAPGVSKKIHAAGFRRWTGDGN